MLSTYLQLCCNLSISTSQIFNNFPSGASHVVTKVQKQCNCHHHLSAPAWDHLQGQHGEGDYAQAALHHQWGSKSGKTHGTADSCAKKLLLVLSNTWVTRRLTLCCVSMRVDRCCPKRTGWSSLVELLANLLYTQMGERTISSCSTCFRSLKHKLLSRSFLFELYILIFCCLTFFLSICITVNKWCIEINFD